MKDSNSCRVFPFYKRPPSAPQSLHAAKQVLAEIFLQDLSLLHHGATRPSQGMRLQEQYLHQHRLFKGSEPQTQALSPNKGAVQGYRQVPVLVSCLHPWVRTHSSSQHHWGRSPSRMKTSCLRARSSRSVDGGAQPVSLGINQACKGEGKGQSCALLTRTTSSPSRVLPALCPGAAVCLGAIAPPDDTNDLSPSAQPPG